jgi:hypothetical protein
VRFIVAVFFLKYAAVASFEISRLQSVFDDYITLIQHEDHTLIPFKKRYESTGINTSFRRVSKKDY